MDKFYTSSDMAKIACDNCNGCSACCEGMGDTIVLTPYDAFELMKNLNCSMELLLAEKVELSVHDGLILPNLKMNEDSMSCGFLNEDKRCNIHGFRPGLCRLFPLGRNYEDGKFTYFVVENGCMKEPKTKVKIEKWLNLPSLKKQETFIAVWHYFIKELQEKMLQTEDETYKKQVNMFVLQLFFMKQYDLSSDFYAQFEERINQARAVI